MTNVVTTPGRAAVAGDSRVLVEAADLLRVEPPGLEYERAREISKYLLMHYGSVEDTFARPDHPLAVAHGYAHRLSEILRRTADQTGCTVRTALDVGCNVGGVTHAMARWVTELAVGIDISPRCVEVARSVALDGRSFEIVEQGPFTRRVRLHLLSDRRAELRFAVGDATAIAGHPGGYDAVLLSNVLDRVADPVACLHQFRGSSEILRPGGLLMIACPWSWYPEYTAPEAWLGSAQDRTPSEQGLSELLAADFTLVSETDEAGVLRQNPREYDYFESHVSVWLKR